MREPDIQAGTISTHEWASIAIRFAVANDVSTAREDVSLANRSSWARTDFELSGGVGDGGRGLHFGWLALSKFLATGRLERPYIQDKMDGGTVWSVLMAQVTFVLADSLFRVSRQAILQTGD